MHLPKGSLQVKELSDKSYSYLSYRKLKYMVKRRKGNENLLKAIKKELILMNKVLEAYK